MVNEKRCLTCGKTLIGRVDKKFCNDACRKYYNRHDGIGLSGLSLLDGMAGQGRTLTSPGTNNVESYFAKRLIDFGVKVAENHFINDNEKSYKPPKLTNTPLQIQSADVLPPSNTTNKFIKKSNTVILSAAFKDFFGELSYPFKMLVWGKPGSGKSTFSMQLADQISNYYKILYIAGEELLDSPTLKSKQNRAIRALNQKSCFFINRLPYSEIEWKSILLEISQTSYIIKHRAIFYDSITKLDITPFYVDAIANDCKMPFFNTRFSHIFIAHAHKDGLMYRGDGSWGHEVDIIIKCDKGIATIEKNRFGESNKSIKRK